jgi:hypothetical protein
MGGAAIGLLIAWPLRRLKDEVVARFHLRPLPSIETGSKKEKRRHSREGGNPGI